MGDLGELRFSDSVGLLSEARVIPRSLPAVGQIRLWLLEDAYPTDPVSAQEYASTMAAPPYWAFCWGGGQALARHIFDNSELVRNKRVVDFGAGSGVAAISAMLQGASKALAVDCDPKALQAIHQNARLNQVQIDKQCSMPIVDTLSHEYDVILAADICYEESGMDWLAGYLNENTQGNRPALMLADSRYPDLHRQMKGLQKVAQYSVRTFPDLDEAEQFDRVTIYSSA